MADNTTLFKKCVFGFSPAEVVAYIEELDAKHAAERKKDAEKIEELTKKLETAPAPAVKEEPSETAKLRASVEDKDAAIAAQVAALGALQKENAALQTELTDTRIQKALLEEKVRQYETTVSDAQKVIADAKEEGRRIVAEAEAAAKEKSDAILAEADEMLSESLKKVRALDCRRDELDAMLRRHKESMDEFFKAVDGDKA